MRDTFGMLHGWAFKLGSTSTAWRPGPCSGCPVQHLLKGAFYFGYHWCMAKRWRRRQTARLSHWKPDGRATSCKRSRWRAAAFRHASGQQAWPDFTPSAPSRNISTSPLHFSRQRLRFRLRAATHPASGALRAARQGPNHRALRHNHTDIAFASLAARSPPDV